MSFLYNNNLKIEFRAVPYASSSHVLEYRISPDQDLIYEKHVSWLWGLIKFKCKCKFSTNWQRAYQFLNYPSAYLYDEGHNYLPIFIKDRKELEMFKFKYKTIGEFFAWRDKEDKREKDEWQIEHTNYLEENKEWY